MSKELNFNIRYVLEKKFNGKEIMTSFSLELNNRNVTMEYRIPEKLAVKEGEYVTSIIFQLTEEEFAAISQKYGEIIEPLKEDSGPFINNGSRLSGNSEEFGTITRYNTEKTEECAKRLAAALKSIREDKFDELEEDYHSLLAEEPKATKIKYSDTFHVFSIGFGVDGECYGEMQARGAVPVEGDRKYGFHISREVASRLVSTRYYNLIEALKNSNPDLDSTTSSIEYECGNKLKLYSGNSVSGDVEAIESVLAENIPDFGRLYSAIKSARVAAAKERREERERQEDSKRRMTFLKNKFPEFFDQNGNFIPEILDIIEGILEEERTKKNQQQPNGSGWPIKR